MFDVGFTELLLLAVIALLVLGPERLPRVARTLGGLSRKARSSWMNLKRSIDAEINAEELKKPLQKVQEEMRSAMDGVDKQLKGVSEQVNSNMSAVIAAAKPAQSTLSSSSDQLPSGPPVTQPADSVSADSPDAYASGNDRS